MDVLSGMSNRMRGRLHFLEPKECKFLKNQFCQIFSRTQNKNKLPKVQDPQSQKQKIQQTQPKITFEQHTQNVQRISTNIIELLNRKNITNLLKYTIISYYPTDNLFNCMSRKDVVMITDCFQIRTSILQLLQYFDINPLPRAQMKLNYPYPQPIKTTQNLVKSILDENTTFNTLDISSINEILGVFKISDTNNMMDRQMKIAKIKQKLLDVIVDEKDQSINYLVLPKFNNISEGARAALKDVLSTTWPTYLSKETEEQKHKKYSRYFCTASNPKQVEQFHVMLFHYLKTTIFYDGIPYFRMMPGFPPIMPPMGPNQAPFSPFNTISNHNHISNQDMQSAFYPPLSIAQHQQPIIPTPEKIKIQDKGEVSDIYMKEEVKKKPVKRKQDVKQNKKQKQREKQKQKQKQSASMQGTYKNFLNCVCKGKYSETQKYFQCQECAKKYHLNCLNIPTHAVQKFGVKKRCPQCYLKNNNSLYSTIEELETFWSDDRELHKQKITIKAKKCKEIQQKKYSIQLRFMKIEGRTMYEWQIPGQTKTQTNSSSHKPILNQVLIKDQVITKGHGQDVKISLDCMKSADRSDDKKSILLFVSINIVQQKTLQQILQGNYQYFQDKYLDKFFKDKGQLKIQLYDINFRLFKKPVRGADCEHAELFDLEQFANHCIDLHTDQCFCCNKRIRTFKIDRQVEEEIKKIKQTFANQQDYPQTIYYQKDGTFKWKDELQGQKQEQQMQDEQDNPKNNQSSQKKQMKNQNDSQMQSEPVMSSLEMSELQESQELQSKSKSKNNKSNKNSKTVKIKKKNKQ